MIVGVTGSLAALGDTLFPATSLGLALAQDFSSTSGWLVRWRWTHPTVAFLASIFLIWLLVRAAQRRTRALGQPQPLRAGADVAGRAICAGRAGRALLAPVWLQVAHLLGADVLWVALVVLTARTHAGAITRQRVVDAAGSIQSSLVW